MSQRKNSCHFGAAAAAAPWARALWSIPCRRRTPRRRPGSSCCRPGRRCQDSCFEILPKCLKHLAPAGAECRERVTRLAGHGGAWRRRHERTESRRAADVQKERAWLQFWPCKRDGAESCCYCQSRLVHTNGARALQMHVAWRTPVPSFFISAESN